MEIEENELCIVCCKPGSSFYLRNNIKEEGTKVHGGVAGQKPAPKSVREMRLLRPQLRAVFLLQEVFKHSLQDDIIQETMEVLGHPSEWLEICARCRDLVDSGIDVIVQLKKYLEAHKRIVEELKRALKSSQEWQPWRSEGDWILVRSETGSRQKQRARFRKMMRKGETEHEEDIVVKVEPEDFASNDGDSQYSSHMDQSAPIPITQFDFTEVNVEGRSVSESTSEVLRKHLLTKKNVHQQETMMACKIITHRTSRSPKISMEAGDQISSSEKRKHSTTFVENARGAAEKSNALKNYDAKKPKRKQQAATRFRKAIRKGEIEHEEVVVKEETENYASNDGDSQHSFPEAPSPITTFPTNEIKVGAVSNNVLTLAPPSALGGELLLGGPSEVQNRWFYERAAEFLDMDLFVYPPPSVTAEKVQDGEIYKYFRKNGVKGGFPCTSCDDTFNNKFHAIAHIQKVHMGIKKPWKCNVCSFKCSVVRTFRRHIQDHEDSAVKTCTVCGTFSCKEQMLMDTHVLNHQKDVSTPTCLECKEEFVNFRTFLNHMLTKHGRLYKDNEDKDDPVRTCQFCDKILSSEMHLKYHLFKTHNHGERDESFPVCSKCGKVFFQKTALDIHMSNGHSEAGPVVRCDHCGKGFMSESRLKVHLNFVHPDEPLNCRVCGLDLKNSRGLRRHVVNYHPETSNLPSKQLEEYVKKKNEEMAFQCNFCSERFAFSNLLSRHQQNDHPELRKFKCDTCGKRYLTKNALLSHTKAAHLKLKTRCTDCGKLMLKRTIAGHKRLNCPARKEKSKEHVQGSEEGTPKKTVDKTICDICGKKFTMRSSVTKHKKVVHMNWKRMCEYCGKSYTNINLHRNKHCPERRKLEEQEEANH